jgi:NAD(P)-dependent dehydrogenase (short-subunit alcohol dehydrogenase family)
LILGLSVAEHPKKIDLSNRTAVVAGSTAGIGFVIAKGLAKAARTRWPYQGGARDRRAERRGA